MENRYNTFLSLIQNINRNIQKIKNVNMEEIGLKGTQVQCLFHLYNEKEMGISSTNLCILCGEDKAAVSRTIKELESYGYVYTEVSEDKKYRNPIKLTKEGEEVGEYVVNKINGYVNLIGDTISDSDREKLYSMLNTISNKLQNICKNMGE